MSDREVRISPNGDAIAIRGDAQDPEAWNAWGVMHAINGGHWSATREIQDWRIATEYVDPPEPAPVAPLNPFPMMMPPIETTQEQ